MDAMPRPRPPHLHRQVTQHGKTVWYVRVGKGPRTRIRAAFGTPEFDAEYQAALAGNHGPDVQKATAAGTLAWLIERYRETTAWTDLSLATRRNRENHFKQAIETAGHQPIRAITQAVIIAARDRRAATPAQARNFLDAMRGLFRWAKEAKHVTVDPTDGVKNPKRKKGPRLSGMDGRLMPPPMTGVGRSAPRNGCGAMYCSIPACGAAMPSGSVASMFATVCDAAHRKEPRRDDRHDPDFADPAAYPRCRSDRRACVHLRQERQAVDQGVVRQRLQGCLQGRGLHNRSAHGCRKIAATRAAEAGATVAQLNAIFGWKGTAMASLYTEAADRKRLALEAMAKVQGAARRTKLQHLFPHLAAR